jgi:ubiquinone/menaquinone biosynthesis C-methylase UbiE
MSGTAALNVSHNPRIGTYDYFERLYEVESQHWWSRGMRAVAAAILKNQYPGKHRLSVLDAGCGTGVTMVWLQEIGLGGQTTGIDVSWDGLRFCQKRSATRLAQSSVLQLPFKQASFDLVVCNDVLQHLPGNGGDRTALREFYRVLRPGGCLILRTNSRLGMGNVQYPESGEYRRYGLEELRAKVREADFRILRATYANTIFSVIPTVKRYLRRNLPNSHTDQGLGIHLLPTHLRWLNALLYGVMRAEAWFLSQPARAARFGHSILLLVQRPETAALN